MMNWDPPELKRTIVLDDIFDPAKGWRFSIAQVPLQRKIYTDGNPYYIVTIDEIGLSVFEQSKWKEGVDRSVSPNRIVVMATFTGVILKDPKLLLRASRNTCGLPSFGLSEQGNITLHAAFPIGPDFPVDWARRQAMVCMGLVAEEAKANLRAWKNAGNPGLDWDTAKNLASVAGTFLRAFVGS